MEEKGENKSLDIYYLRKEGCVWHSAKWQYVEFFHSLDGWQNSLFGLDIASLFGGSC